MNWMIIVGILCVIGGIGNITIDIGTFFFGIIVGAAFLFFGLRKKGYFKNIQLKNPFKKRVISTEKQRGTLDRKTHQHEIGGCVLAYSYDDVKFFPPVEMVSKINKAKFQAGAELHLVQEPWNTYDHAAVAIYLDNRQIGYLLRGTLQDMANDYITRGWPIKATLVSLKKCGDEYHGYIDLAYYRPGKK